MRRKANCLRDMLVQKGFAFPACYASGNPTTRKDYDEGYLVLDANHKLFHLKCTKGRPYVKAIQLPEGVLPEYVFITEFRSRRTLGYMVDSKHHFYIINSDGSLVKSALPGFDPAKDELTIFGNMFDWTVKLSTDKDDYYYALDATDYSLIKEHDAGMSAQLMAKEGKYATLRLPSGEMRMVPINCRATVGVIGNGDHSLINIGKAGRKRHMGIRPTVRGSVMNPNDHPHGGGEGKTGIGRPGPCTPWGKPALGLKTRKKNKQSNKLIVRRRDGKAIK